MASLVIVSPANTEPADDANDFLQALRQGQAYRDNIAFLWDYQSTIKDSTGNDTTQLLTGRSRFVHSGDNLRHNMQIVNTGFDGLSVVQFISLDHRYDGTRIERFQRSGTALNEGEPYESFDIASPDEVAYSLRESWSIASPKRNAGAMIGTAGDALPLFGALPSTAVLWLDEFLASRSMNPERLDDPCDTCPPHAVGWRFYDDNVNIKIWLDPAKGHQITGLDALVLRGAFFNPDSTFTGDYRQLRLTDISIENVDGHWVPVRGSYDYEVPAGFYGLAQESWADFEKAPNVVQFAVDVQLFDFDFDSTYNEDFFRHEFPVGAVVHDLDAGIQLVAQADGRALKRKTDPVDKVLATIQQEAREIRRLVQD
jgi:hypothetical protein